MRSERVTGWSTGERVVGITGFGGGMAEALELIRARRVDRAGHISHRFSLAEVARAFTTQCQPEAVKVLLECASPDA